MEPEFEVPSPLPFVRSLFLRTVTSNAAASFASTAAVTATLANVAIAVVYTSPAQNFTKRHVKS